MATKKSARKETSKKSQKTKGGSPKKAQKKKGKKTGKGKSSRTKTKSRSVKPAKKKKSSVTKSSRKKKVTAKKAVRKKIGSKRGVSKPKSKKTSTSSTGTSKASSRKGPVTKKRSSKKVAARVSKNLTKGRRGGVSPRSQTPSVSRELTGTDRYNLGGLLACAIDRISDPHFDRLRAALRDLNLTSLEKDNLIRLSQGFTIPKLFADGFPLEKANSAVQQLVKFARGEREYEEEWKEDIRQVAAWLGIFGEEVESIEGRSSSKK